MNDFIIKILQNVLIKLLIDFISPTINGKIKYLVMSFLKIMHLIGQRFDMRIFKRAGNVLVLFLFFIEVVFLKTITQENFNIETKKMLFEQLFQFSGLLILIRS